MATSIEERNKQRVQYFYEELWNKGRLEVADEVFAPDFVGHAPGSQDDTKGPEGVKKVVTMFRKATPDVKLVIDAQYAEGDKVGSRFTLTGTQTGSLMGIRPTGRPIKMYGMAITRFNDEGMVVSDWGEFDLLGVLAQIGVMPTPPQPEGDASESGNAVP